MKAFVAVERGVYELRDMPMPKVGERDVLIRLKAAAICGSDVHIYDGDMDPLCGYPIIMGHENAGVIAEVGPKAPGNWKVGDRVTSENTVSVCGECYSCMTGEYVACETREGFGIAADGVLAEYVVVPGDILAFAPQCLMRIPDNIDFGAATLMEPAANAYKTVFQEGGLIAGEMVLVGGAGTFGDYVAHMASIGGAAKIAMLVRKSTTPQKRELARKMGVTDFVESDDPAAAKEELLRLTNGFGFDLAVETSGAPAVLNTCIEGVHTHGRVVRVAIGNQPYNYGLDALTLRSVRLLGHLGYNAVSWHNVMNLAAAGKLDLSTVVTHEFPLSRADEAFKLVSAHQAAKVVIRIDEE